jgi:hypothetical protein
MENVLALQLFEYDPEEPCRDSNVSCNSGTSCVSNFSGEPGLPTP